MANYRVFVDSFTSLDDIPKKQRAKTDVLLAFFQKTGTRRVSTFEMDDRIMTAMQQLEKDGKLEWVESGYPWHEFKLTDAAYGHSAELPQEK